MREIDHSRKYHNIPSCSLLVTSKFCISIVFSFSWGHFNSQQKLQTMLMKNLGLTNKEHYGMLWYFLEWSISPLFAYATVLILCVKTCVGLATKFRIFFGILDMKKNFRKSQEPLGKKSTNSRILEQFEHSADILAISFTAKTLTKRFLLYSYQPREGSVRLNATAVSRALSTKPNKLAAFHQSRLHYNL